MQLQTEGAECSSVQLSKITLASECENAANALGLTFEPCCQNQSNEPYGCFFRESSSDVLFTGNVDGVAQYGGRFELCGPSVEPRASFAFVQYGGCADGITVDLEAPGSFEEATEAMLNEDQCAENGAQLFYSAENGAMCAAAAEFDGCTSNGDGNTDWQTYVLTYYHGKLTNFRKINSISIEKQYGEIFELDFFEL